MSFGFWNIQGLNTKQREVMSELAKANVDVAVLSETKKKGSGCEKVDGFSLFYSGVDKSCRAKAGVAIVVKSSLTKYIVSWEAIDERIVMIRLKIRGHNILIVGVYAPNDDAVGAVKEEFYENLAAVLEKVPKSSEIILGGDLNGRVGRDRNSAIVGPYGEDEINDNGERLIDVASQFDLRIMNSFFEHKDIHKYTWHQDTRGLKSIIDYVITKQDSKLKFQDVRVKRGAECGSDHWLLEAKVFIPYIKREKEKEGIDEIKELTQVDTILFNLDGFDNDSTRYLYQKRLEGKLIQRERTTEGEYEHIKSCVLEAAQEALGLREKVEKPQWWNQEVAELIQQKKEAYMNYLSIGSDDRREVYKRLTRQVKVRVRQSKEESWSRKCEYVESMIGGSKSYEAWRTLKKMKTSKNEKFNINGIGVEDWQNYFGQLLQEDRDEFKEIVELDEDGGERVQISLQEMEAAIRSIKIRKSPGFGSVYPELIKFSPAKLTRMLKTLFERCLNGEAVPKEWRSCYITPIFKKGKKEDPNNYRGLAVIPFVGRLYSSVLKNIFERETVHLQQEEQAGFRAGRSTTDNIFILKHLLEKRCMYNEETHIAFIDLEKAYDNVPISEMWKQLKRIGINAKLIQAAQNLYSRNTARVRIGNKLSGIFEVSKGLRQGCGLSPTLFKLFLVGVMRKWQRKCEPMGINVGNDKIFTLYFADDQVVLAEDQEDLSYMVRKLREEYEATGLKLNTAKCEYLIVGNDALEDLCLEGDVIKGVPMSKYLGVIFNKSGNSKEEVEERIRKGRKVTRAFNSIWWDRGISRRSKKRIYESMVQSVVLYGAEVWDLRKSNKDKLMATEMDVLRRSCRKTRLDRVRNEEIRRTMNMDNDILDVVQKKQLIWFGHLNRMDENRIPRKVLDWVPQGKRRRGRPRRSWSMEVEEAMRTRGLEVGSWADRNAWRLGAERRREL